MSVTYPESAYRWLVGVLDCFIEVVHRHEKHGVKALTEEDYEFLDEVLGELIYSIGEEKNHPLAALMASVVWLIDAYEDEYVLEPTVSLLEGEANGTGNAAINTEFEKDQDKELDSTTADFTEEICRKPNLAAVYVNLGAVKVKLHRIDEAKSNFQTALELAEQRGPAALKAAIEEQLLQLNHSAS